jgi:hypothetical protein
MRQQVYHSTNLLSAHTAYVFSFHTHTVLLLLHLDRIKAFLSAT